MSGILGAMVSDVDFEIYDGSTNNKEKLLFDFRTNHDDTLLYEKKTIMINRHAWTLTFGTSNIFKSENKYIIFLIPSFILILTLLLFFLLKSLIKTKEHALKTASKSALEYMQLVNKNVISSTTDLSGKILRVSDAFCKISGYSRDELVGKNHNILRHPDTPKTTYEELWNTIQAGNIWVGEVQDKNKDGSSFWAYTTISPVKNEQGKIIEYTAIRHDITDKKRIEELSITDRLTQLYNRLKLDEIFVMKLATAGRYNTPFSVIMIDIDYFKLVNDTWGHQAGDDVLKEFAEIIKNNIRETDIAGRWGGEEFLILSSDTDINGAIELSKKLKEIIDSFKFSFAGHKTASFGVSSYHAGDDENTMVKRADEALYRAKEDGRDKVLAEEY